MFTRRQTFSLIAGAAVAAALPLGSTRAADEAKTFRIGLQKGGVIALARANGSIEKRLAERGVTVTWSEFTSGPPLLEALGANAIDFGSTGDIPPLFAQAAGGDLVYVAAAKSSVAGSAILVAKDSPIQTLADLKGKKFAFKRGSSSHNFAVKALRQAGLLLSDVTEIDLSPADGAAAFATGQIDAWAIWDPFYAIAEQDPNTRVLVTTEGITDSWGFYQANGAYAKANPNIVADVIDELARLGVWSQDHLEETIQQISDITGVPPEVQRVALTRKGSDLGQIHPITDEVLAYQQALADEFYDLGIIPKKLTISDIVWYPPNEG